MKRALALSGIFLLSLAWSAAPMRGQGADQRSQAQAAQAQATQALTLVLSPSRILLETFYSGAQVRVTGIAPAGAELLVTVKGPKAEEELNRKARVGPIWINRGKVHIAGAPSLFLSFSTRPARDLLARGVLDELQLDEAAIREGMRVSPEGFDQPVIRANFIAMKKNQNVYQEEAGPVKLGPAGPAGVPYSLEFHWPRKAPPGSYTVEVVACRGGGVEATTSSQLVLEEVGFPAWMAKLARERGSLYGLLSVLVALLAGFGIDFVASRLGKKGVMAH
ncbi:MAG: TIGR02186 family protein [Acidobacteriota bacterium]